MKTTDRRHWLKTGGLSSGFAFLGGIAALAHHFEPRPFKLDGVVKLNSNENPFGPSEKVRATIAKSFDIACLYPSIVFSELVGMIAEKEGVTKDHIVVTGGSTKGLKATGLAYSIGGKEIIATDPTYQALMRYTENFGAHVQRVSVDEGIGHDLEAMGKRVTNRTGLIFICNPITLPEHCWINRL